VGIDVKESSLNAIAASPYPADLLLNPLKIDATDAVQKIQALRPEGYDYGLGVDGECAEHSSLSLNFPVSPIPTLLHPKLKLQHSSC
jgi:hypothetical protein